MTNNKDLKAIQQQFKEQLNTPKTYEVKYVDLTAKESKITKFASYLGIKTVENCCHLRPVPIKNDNSSGSSTSSSSSTSVSSTKSTQAEVVAATIKTTAEVGGKSTIKTNADGTTNITYDSGKSAK